MKTILIFAWFILLSVPVFGLNRYPEWFLFPKKYPKVITGYSYSGNTAEFDAENMYCAYRSCVVYGTLEIYQDPQNNDWLKNSDYYYYFSPDSVRKIHGQLVELDSFATEIITGDYIAAFELPPVDSTFESPWIEVSTLPKPDWLDKAFWQDETYYYGVGLYTSTGNENDAWKTAEEQGIFTILTNLAVAVFKLRQTEQNADESSASMMEISFLNLRYLLNNIKILERYPDNEYQVYYTLVRIPKQDVHTPMLGK